jgi:signal peptidase I
MKQGFSRKRPQVIWIWIGVGIIITGVWFLVRTFVVGSYSVPTIAMEKTIHRGSKVLVNKLNYRPINRGDILVFHFPVGDTVIAFRNSPHLESPGKNVKGWFCPED